MTETGRKGRLVGGEAREGVGGSAMQSFDGYGIEYSSFYLSEVFGEF